MPENPFSKPAVPAGMPLKIWELRGGPRPSQRPVTLGMRNANYEISTVNQATGIGIDPVTQQSNVPIPQAGGGTAYAVLSTGPYNTSYITSLDGVFVTDFRTDFNDTDLKADQ